MALRTLLIDDSEDDTELVVRHLKRQGCEIFWQRVDTENALRAALAERTWDVALCDYVMPQLSGPEALRILHAEAPDLPAITLSGQIGEEYAVEVMRAGARDYVCKDNLSRLWPAIERELAEARRRRHLAHVETALEISEDRFRAMFEQAPLGIAVLDAVSGRILEANPVYARIVGRSRAALVATDWMSITHPDDVEAERDELSRLVDGSVAHCSFRKRYVRPDGSIVWAQLTVARVADVDLQRSGHLCMVEDVTERDAASLVAAESALHVKHLNDVLRAIRAVGSVIAHERDRSALLRGICESLVRTRGYVKVWIGETESGTKRVLPVAWAGGGMEFLKQAPITWDDSPTGQGPAGTAVRERRPVVFNRVAEDPRFAPWREPVVADGVASIASMPLVNGDRVFGVLTVKSDRTDRFDDDEIEMLGTLGRDVASALQHLEDDAARRQAEESLAAARDLYFGLLDRAPLLVWRAGPDGACDWFNKGWLAFTGRTLEQESGDGWVRGVHPDDRGWIVEKYRDCFGRREAFQVDYRLRRHDGEYRRIHDFGSPFESYDGEFAGYIGFCYDLTEQRRAADALLAENEQRHAREAAEAANAELEAFNYSVSHDLRAPLRHIEGFIRILDEDYGAQLPAEARTYITRIRDGSERMDRMIAALLRLSRVGRAPLEPRRTDLAALARASIADLRAAETGRPVEVVVGDLPEVVCDPALLRQVFDNLLGNALKFTRRAPVARIEVGVESGAGGTSFFVRDNGVGFDQQHVDQLFEAFHRLHGTDFEGAGIGLSIVKRIVEKHGGRVWADSTSGDGATFHFTLGLLADAKLAPAPPAEHDPAG